MNQARSHVSYNKSDIDYSTYIPTVYLHIAYVDKHKNKVRCGPLMQLNF